MYELLLSFINQDLFKTLAGDIFYSMSTSHVTFRPGILHIMEVRSGIKRVAAVQLLPL